jgi:ABC-type transporter lipoprotein component MlaA
VSIWFNLMTFHRTIVRPILRLYKNVVISLVRRITKSLKGNLIRWWIQLKLIKGDKGL